VRAHTDTHGDAQSLDGSIASSRRLQLPLSGPLALGMTHCLRASHAAILVGIGTVLADDPRLTARIPVRPASPAAPPCPIQAGSRRHGGGGVWGGGGAKVPAPSQPQPLIVDPRLEMPLDAYLLSDAARPVRPWLFCLDDADPARRAALEARGARVVVCTRRGPGTPPRLDLDEVLERAAAAGVRSVMVEGGARILASFLHAPQLVDRVVVTIAPVYVGGLNVVTGWVGPVHTLAALPDRPPDSFFRRLRDVQYEVLDGDMVLAARL
jgi:riboflavin-specific deaminase-like protein